MFTKNNKRPPAATQRTAGPKRGRGRPRGVTEQGLAARRRLYDVALALIASKGYETTTLRTIAKKAGVSVGLLYRYFPSKDAVVLAFYDELSSQYTTRASRMGPGPWRERFLFALRASLAALVGHRVTLAALTPILVGDTDDGIFAPATTSSRQRVQAVFREAVEGASDAPAPADAAALGRLLYVVHLAILLWWLLDKSPRQTATARLVEVLEETLPTLTLMLQLGPASAFLGTADELCREALFGEKDDPKAARKEDP